MDELSYIRVLLALTVLAGCSAPQHPQTKTEVDHSTKPAPTHLPKTPTETQQEGIEVVGGSLPFDPDAVFHRTQQLLETNVSPPKKIVIRTMPTQTDRRVDKLYATLTGVQSVRLPVDPPSGSVIRPDTVYIYPGDSNKSELEKVLVHEFVHVVQFRLGVLSHSDVRFHIKASLLQGSAMYVADAYAERFDLLGTAQSKKLSVLYNNSTPEQRLKLWQNYFGYRYVASKTNSPEAVLDVFAHPPTTTEQLIHGYEPHAGPTPRITTTVVNSQSLWLNTGTSRKGELFIRLLLEQSLGREEAAVAGEGWDADHLFTFWNGKNDTYSYVWLLRWKNHSEVSEFSKGLERFMSNQGIKIEDGWSIGNQLVRIQTLDPTTVSVTVGPAQFANSVRFETGENGVILYIGS